MLIFLPTSFKPLNLKTGTGQRSPSHCKRRSASRPPDEPQHTKVHRSPEGIIWCSCQATLNHISKVMSVKPSPSDWGKGNLTPFFKKGERKDSRNYQSVSPWSVPGKIKEDVSKYIKDRETIRDSQRQIMPD